MPSVVQWLSEEHGGRPLFSHRPQQGSVINATNTGETKPIDQILAGVNGLSSAESCWFTVAEALILNPLVFLNPALFTASGGHLLNWVQPYSTNFEQLCACLVTLIRSNIYLWGKLSGS